MIDELKHFERILFSESFSCEEKSSRLYKILVKIKLTRWIISHVFKSILHFLRIMPSQWPIAFFLIKQLFWKDSMISLLCFSKKKDEFLKILCFFNTQETCGDSLLLFYLLQSIYRMDGWQSIQQDSLTVLKQCQKLTKVHQPENIPYCSLRDWLCRLWLLFPQCEQNDTPIVQLTLYWISQSNVPLQKKKLPFLLFFQKSSHFQTYECREYNVLYIFFYFILSLKASCSSDIQYVVLIIPQKRCLATVKSVLLDPFFCSPEIVYSLWKALCYHIKREKPPFPTFLSNKNGQSTSIHDILSCLLYVFSDFHTPLPFIASKQESFFSSLLYAFLCVVGLKILSPTTSKEGMFLLCYLSFFGPYPLCLNHQNVPSILSLITLLEKIKFLWESSQCVSKDSAKLLVTILIHFYSLLNNQEKLECYICSVENQDYASEETMHTNTEVTQFHGDLWAAFSNDILFPSAKCIPFYTITSVMLSTTALPVCRILRAVSDAQNSLGLFYPEGNLESQIILKTFSSAEECNLLNKRRPFKFFSQPSHDSIKTLPIKESPCKDVNLLWRTQRIRFKYPKAFVGLKNAACYMNALLQSLYLCTSFTMRLFQYKICEAREKRRQNTLYQLQKLFFKLLTCKRQWISTKQLMKTLPKFFNEGYQQDVCEAARRFFTHLESYGTKLVDIIFSCILSMETQCLHCHNISRVFERHIDLGFPIPTYQQYHDNLNRDCRYFVSVQTLLNDYFKKEILRDQNYFCHRCHTKVQAMRYNTLVKYPQHLFLVLHRFSWNSVLQCHSKEMTPIKIDSIVEIHNMVYVLYCIIFHMGTSDDSGHYITIGKCSQMNASYTCSQWYCFNDSCVKEEKVMIKENNGEWTCCSQQLTTTPYILFYKCKDIAESSC